MTISIKKDFWRCLKEINAPKEVKTKINEKVERLNDNMEIREYYYDWFEEQKRINAGIVAEKVEEALEKATQKAVEKAVEETTQKVKEEERKIIVQKMIASGMTHEEITKILQS